jgi:hypothetical protein
MKPPVFSRALKRRKFDWLRVLSNHVYIYLRAINDGILDTYQLKSLDALLGESTKCCQHAESFVTQNIHYSSCGFTEAPLEELAVIKKDNKLYVDAFHGTGEHALFTDKLTKNSEQRTFSCCFFSLNSVWGMGTKFCKIVKFSKKVIFQ